MYLKGQNIFHLFKYFKHKFINLHHFVIFLLMLAQLGLIFSFVWYQIVILVILSFIYYSFMQICLTVGYKFWFIFQLRKITCRKSHGMDYRLFVLCLINTSILVCWHVRCDCKLWNATWFCCVFLEFSYLIDDHLCLKYFIFTKLLQIVYLIDVPSLVYQHAKCDCRLWKILWFFGVFRNFHIFIHIWNVKTSSNFKKLCIKIEI